jgi:hypothetical protein
VIKALKRVPWMSLTLLLAAQTVFGKFLVDLDKSWFVFWFAIAWSLFLAIIFMRPLTGLRRFIQRWFQSDAVAFTALVGVAAFASILLNWFKLFLPVFLIISAESLARLDMQTAEFRDRNACFLLTLISWSGLALGWQIGQSGWEVYLP